MMNFLLAGGWPTWWLLLLGLPLIVLAGVFMFKASPTRLAVIRALSTAVVFASLAGVVTDLIAVAWNEQLPGEPDYVFLLVQGIGESLTPAALGFTILSLAWLFVAVGMRRARELAE